MVRLTGTHAGEHEVCKVAARIQNPVDMIESRSEAHL